MTTILLIHIISASLLTVASVVLAGLSFFRKKQSGVFKALDVSFVATLITGVALVFQSNKALTHFCMMMTAYTLSTILVRILYKKRVLAYYYQTAK